MYVARINFSKYQIENVNNFPKIILLKSIIEWERYVDRHKTKKTVNSYKSFDH